MIGMTLEEQRKYYEEVWNEYRSYYLPLLLTKYAQAYETHEAHSFGHPERQKAQQRMNVVKDLLIEQIKGRK